MSRSAKIAALDDDLRRTMSSERIYKTDGVDALDVDVQAKILEAVRTFVDFTTHNDPYGEHDFGAVEVESHRCVQKIHCKRCSSPTCPSALNTSMLGLHEDRSI